MKKIVPLLLLIFVANACSSDDTNSPQAYLLPIESVEMPSTDQFQANHVYQIKVRYKRITTCHIFNGFYMTTDGLTHTVAVSCWKLDQDNCIVDESIFEIPMDFKPTQPGDHVLRFWTGDTGAANAPQYIERTVHVE